MWFLVLDRVTVFTISSAEICFFSSFMIVIGDYRRNVYSKFAPMERQSYALRFQAIQWAIEKKKFERLKERKERKKKKRKEETESKIERKKESTSVSHTFICVFIYYTFESRLPAIFVMQMKRKIAISICGPEFQEREKKET